MTELLGLATMTRLGRHRERPAGGPSTGLPTKSEQSDLFQAVFGPRRPARVVLAATDVEDSFPHHRRAFNISEEFQIPVIVLSEQVISGDARG